MRRVSIALVGVLALALTLLPAGVASANHFGMLELDVEIREPGDSGDEPIDDIVTNNVEFVITARNTTDTPLADTSLALNLPDGFVFASAGMEGTTTEVDCRTVEDGKPDVLCDIGDLDGSRTIVITADSRARAASTITALAYATWADFDAVYAMDTAVLANNTLRLVNTTAEDATETVSFEVRNTSSTVSRAENVTVEIRLPNPEAEVDVTVSNSSGGECEQLDTADGNVICQNLIVPATGPLSESPVGSVVTPEITISRLEADNLDILAEGKGDVTTRAVLELNADGSEARSEFHDAATRTAGAVGQTRTVTAKVGALLNDEAIALPATDFTPVGGEVRLQVSDLANTGTATAEWTEGDVRYRYEATEFRNLREEMDYFQDGGVNFDTHQHDMTFRPNGPDAIPDLWVQALVYVEGTLTRTNADGSEDTFENVGMHAMSRQLAVPEEGLEPFQRWADKGPIPERTATTPLGGPAPAVPTNLQTVDVLFQNTPTADGECEFNGIAGDSCDPDLGQFVRLMTFVFTPYADGFNVSGIDLTTNNPTQNVTDRFQSFLPPPLGGAEGSESAVKVSLEVSTKTFATADAEDDPREADAEYAVLGRSDVFADSLAGSGLAADRGPLLFTESAELNATVRAELDRVLADESTVYLLGGPTALSPAIEATLENDGFTVERLSGETRFETAEAVADEVRELNPDTTEQLLARAFDDMGGNSTQAWADSVSGGAYAADQQIPIILTTTDELHPAAERALEADDDTFILGGPAAVSDDVAAEVDDASGEVERIRGETRVETSIAVSRELFDRDEGDAAAGDEFLISPGFAELGWAYGLSASPHSALNDAPLLLLAEREGGEPTLTDSLREYLSGLGFSAEAQGYATTSSSLPNDYVAIEVLDLLAGEDDDESTT
jgi:putative cell wall-binding protein